MQRLSAEEFLERLKNANGWSITRYPSTGELELVTWDYGPGNADKKIEPVVYGPDPLDMDITEYSRFLKEVFVLAHCTEPVDSSDIADKIRNWWPAL